ncbi:MAG: MFS transporter [Cyclobacteriaceae bacterium]|nr:MFS transporter [Cyclobacteriaceae bacterium]
METRSKQRIALSTFFFLSGLCFSTWASRIPTLKSTLDINEAELGSLLFVMPISSMFGLPVSGWLVSKFDSRLPLFVGFVLHAVFLLLIGFATSIAMLVVLISFFAFFMRIFNIAVNTQSLTLQKMFEKKINGSFHGLWSLGGIAGVGVSTIMLGLEVPMDIHLALVAVVSILFAGLAYRHLIVGDKSESGNKLQFGKPDSQILLLGILILFAAICEGGMFDWSGVYFKEVIKVEIFTAGYLIFMTCMAFSRFVSDMVVNKIGMKAMYAISSVMIAIGMAIAVVFPTFWLAMLGFSLVGLGTAAVVPMTFLLAGTSRKYSPGISLSIVVTYAMIGILLGPVLIGYIAHAFNLRASFAFLALAGLAIWPISRYYFKKHGGLEL